MKRRLRAMYRAVQAKESTKTRSFTLYKQRNQSIEERLIVGFLAGAAALSRSRSHKAPSLSLCLVDGLLHSCVDCGFPLPLQKGRGACTRSHQNSFKNIWNASVAARPNNLRSNHCPKPSPSSILFKCNLQSRDSRKSLAYQLPTLKKCYAMHRGK